jgi:hypothetical protein
MLQPPNLPPYPLSLPPVRPPPQNQDPPEPTQPSTTALTAPALSDLQGQLHDTQSSLAVHIDKVRALEGVLAEHDAMK